MTSLRIGQGFDVHRFSDDPGRPCILGGVHFPNCRGLEGHSDADAVAHACADALLGAAGLGDIGSHFPDTDPKWAGADSIELLRRAVSSIEEAGYAPVNIDCKVVTARPRLVDRRAEMQERLSAAAGAPVTVAGRRPEGLGSIGREEGVMVFAVALVERSDGSER